MFKKYKLLKEWPDAKVGDVYQWNGQGYSNQNRTAMVISKNYVEKYSEWFEEILEKVVITGFLKWGANDIILYGNSPLYIHFEKIKKAIESVLNCPESELDDGKILETKIVESLNKMESGYQIVKPHDNSLTSQIEIQSEKIYTEKDNAASRCGLCGGEQVLIRGKFPNDDKRYVCPTCGQERLDEINNISSPHYGKAFQNSTSNQTT